MRGDINKVQMKDQYELYNRLQNDHRKKLLSFIYSQPRTYTEMIEHTDLKPGSLYHHLNLLFPLISKESHGLYVITEIGREIVEEFDLVAETKPEVVPLSGNGEKGADGEIIGTRVFRNYSSDDLLALIWNSWTTYVFIALIAGVTLLLGNEGVSLAGTALYATNTKVAFLYDFLAVSIGWLVIYTMESIIYDHNIYHRVKFTGIIRIFSMLPATIMGLSLWLLYLGGISPSTIIYPVIFAISVGLGTLAAASGIQYLRGVTVTDGIQWAVAMSTVDLLLGIVILVS